MLKLDNKGMTLLEVVIAMAIFTLIISAIVGVFMSAFTTKDIVFEQLSVQNQGRKVVQDFVNELRGATYSSIGSYPLAEASTTEIIFYTNLNADSQRARVRYFLATTTLKKGVVLATGNPLTYVTSTEVITNVVSSVSRSSSTPIFYYYDANFSGSQSPLAQPVNTSQVRVVGINLILDKNPNASPTSFTIQAKSEIRNLKDN